MDREPKDVEAALAHDLNNYLQVVMGNLEVLRRRAAFAPDVVDAALNATRHAAQLADRISAMGRLRNPQPQRFDVNQVLNELREMVVRTLGDTIRVELELTEGLARAVVDPRCLQVALLELATNSRDAMPGGGKFTVRTGRAGVGMLKVEI